MPLLTSARMPPTKRLRFSWLRNSAMPTSCHASPSVVFQIGLGASSVPMFPHTMPFQMPLRMWLR
eukprot:856558-Alexandrium_andersonii.AAC.1